MANRSRHTGLTREQQLLVDAYKQMKSIIVGVSEEVLSSVRTISEADRVLIQKHFKAKVENNARLLRSVESIIFSIRNEVEKLSRQKLRKDHLGRYLIYPLENRISDKMQRNWIYRDLIKDYIVVLKSILGIEFVTDCQAKVSRIVSRYRRNDLVDWEEVFEDKESRDILKLIARTLRERFSTPHAMPFFIKRMNQSQVYKNSGERYTEEDFSVYLKLLFRCEEELS